MSKTLLAYIQLMRLSRPIGSILLWWSCVWGIQFSYKFNPALTLVDGFKMLALTFVGAVAARSLGCIINDLADRKIDCHVERTKNRPLACGALSMRQAFTAAAFTLLICLLVWLNLPAQSRIWCCIGLVLLVVYPFMKRYTYHPQVVLGFAFSMGIPVTFTALSHTNPFYNLPLPALFLCLTSICWIVAFDTIYAFQDIKDDESVGVKSTARAYHNHPKLALAIWYMIGAFGLLMHNMTLDPQHHISAAAFQMNLIAYMSWVVLVLWKVDVSSPQSCLFWFKAHAKGAVCLLLS